MNELSMWLRGSGVPKHVHTVLSFACGCMVIPLLWWLSADLKAAKLLFDPATAIHVCVAEDGVLRLTDMGVECALRQKSLYLKKAEADVDFDQKEEQEKTNEPNDREVIDKNQLADLERRVKALEDAANRGEFGNRVVAPFEVVDRAGRKVFDVDTEDGGVRAQLYNKAGKGVATSWATDGGGQFVATSADSALTTYAGIFKSGKGSGVKVLESGTERLDLGRDAETGRYRLKVFGPGGSLVAGIGQEGTSGTGVAIVSDQKGKPKATIGIGLGSLGGKGVVTIFNDSTTPVAELREGENGGGLLTIRSSSNQAAVEAGVDAKGFGVVRAGPEGFKPGLGVLGLPSSFIAGKPK